MPKVQLPGNFTVELSLTRNPTLANKAPWSRSCSLSEVLARHPGAPYTTVVTVNQGTAIPMLDFHCNRMLKAMEELYPDMPPLDPSNLRNSLLWLISHVSVLRTSGTGELQIVPVLLVENEKLYLSCHASDIANPMDDITVVNVDCRGKPRINPQVKNSAWATQRKALERTRIRGVSETILVGSDNDGFHSLLEGLVSNLFVVTQSLEVWTAPGHLVLPGSLRECVLVACEELGVHVIHRPIRLANFNEFEAAFLTNARRYLHPIRSMHIPDHDLTCNCPRLINLPNGPAATELINKLRSVVCRLLIRNATRILPSANIIQNAE